MNGTGTGSAAAPPLGNAPTATCMLVIGDRVVLRAGAPPDTEYLLFDPSEIELRASEPGRVREHGYLTTVGDARLRLANAGATATDARAAAAAMLPVLAEAYARGLAVRRIARYLGPAEMLQTDAYDPGTQTYRGVFLDLPGLARDLGIPSAMATLQALFLAVLLETEGENTKVLLATDAWTRQRKPGERTYKKAVVGQVRALLAAVEALSSRAPRPDVRETLPRADVLAFVRARADAAEDEDARALYASLARSVEERPMPDRGPLAEPMLWAIEARIDRGELNELVASIDEVERARGRTPGTTYLRARAALVLGLEPAKLIAERVSALALSMNAFQELTLLAADAWLEAGEPRRAAPYARDLVESTAVDEGLLLRAQRLLARALGGAPPADVVRSTLTDAILVSPLPPSRPPQALASVAPRTSSFPPQRGSQPPEEPAEPFLRTPSNPPAMAASQPLRADAIALDFDFTPPPPPREPFDLALDAPRLPATSPVAASMPSSAFTSVPRTRSSAPPPAYPPASSPPQSAPPIQRNEGASFTMELPAPEMPLERTSRAPSGAPRERTSRGPQSRMGGVRVETVAPAAFDPRAEPNEHGPARARSSLSPASSRPPSIRPVASKISRAPAPTASTAPLPNESKITNRLDRSTRETLREAGSDHPSPKPARPLEPPPPTFDLSAPRAPAFGPEADTQPRGRSSMDVEASTLRMRGASLPPYRVENPPPPIARAPLLPKTGGAEDELAEELALPPGLSADVQAGLPRSVLEARVQFTLLARELGADYREKRGIRLRADISGIEAMQAVLLETFRGRAVMTESDVREVRRHGALLSEILARRFDADWVDISPLEVGRWAMIVPPDTRVWPFGRILRLIQMGHRERDLVSYYLELRARTRHA